MDLDISSESEVLDHFHHYAIMHQGALYHMAGRSCKIWIPKSFDNNSFSLSFSFNTFGSKEFSCES